jgi:hypothetical protein
MSAYRRRAVCRAIYYRIFGTDIITLSYGGDRQRNEFDSIKVSFITEKEGGMFLIWLCTLMIL